MKITIFLFILLSLNTYSQETEEPLYQPVKSKQHDTIVEKEVVDFPDKPAEFPGGMDNLRMYISTHFVYPSAALSESIQGKVYASFIVNSDGTISDVKIMRGLRKDCDEEVIRMILAMPKWTPAIHFEKIVNSKIVIPVSFKISN